MPWQAEILVKPARESGRQEEQAGGTVSLPDDPTRLYAVIKEDAAIGRNYRILLQPDLHARVRAVEDQCGQAGQAIIGNNNRRRIGTAPGYSSPVVLHARIMNDASKGSPTPISTMQSFVDGTPQNPNHWSG